MTARLAPSTVIYVAYGARSLTAPPVVEDVQAFFAEHGIPQSAQQLRRDPGGAACERSVHGARTG